jgi:DNA-binding MarR family transcriptional regulator
MATPKTKRASQLQKELKQSAPFESVAVEVYLNLMRTHGLLTRAQSALLKEHQLTLALYNIMRILRGAGRDGLPCTEIGRRMITREPDVTRHIDRLVKRGFVARKHSETDRRVVIQTLTPAGQKMLLKLDGPMREVGEVQLAHMTDAELKRLNELLVKARANVAVS